MYHAIKFAKSHDSAFQLGIEGVKDKSKKVRYRACMLLAVSQRNDAITELQFLLDDPDSSADAKAAIEAIKHQDHNYFVDRDHSGRVMLNV